MMAFPSMVVDASEKAGIKVPPDTDDFSPEVFPHFYVFCRLQLNRPIHWGEHWENAKVIATVSDDKILSHALEDFLDAGLRWQS